MMKSAQNRIVINQLRAGDRCEQVFLVASRELRQTKAGKYYIRAVLQDSSGQMDAVMWDASESIAADMPPESFIKGQVRVEQYQGTLQMVLESFRPVGAETVELGDFLQHTDKDVGELSKSVLGHLRKVKDKALLQLIKQFVADEQLMERFRSAPAAMGMHHAYVGGLLEHTENMLASASRLLEAYPQLNADPGQLLGHLVQAVLMLQEKAKLAAKDLGGEFPAETLNQLMHIILSHHGQYEFGSPVLPATAEAVMIHYLDNIDAKLNGLQQALESALPGDGNWTGWLKMFERKMYNPKG